MDRRSSTHTLKSRMDIGFQSMQRSLQAAKRHKKSPSTCELGLFSLLRLAIRCRYPQWSRQHPTRCHSRRACRRPQRGFHSPTIRLTDVSACDAAVLAAGHRFELPAADANRALHPVSAHCSLAPDSGRGGDHAQESPSAFRVIGPALEPTPGYRARYGFRARSTHPIVHRYDPVPGWH